MARKALVILGTLALGAPVSTPAAGEEPVVHPKTVVDEASGVSETVFSNGLTLLVRPQPENPVVTTMIWYAVGSRDESVGETGLSHYLEHMLFKGTAKYPVGAIDKVTQLAGGTNNASTRDDCTEYHFTFPADRWEAALEIESDRMRNSAVVESEFQNEKKVVLNELYIGLDDPANVLTETVESAVFPVARYHHPVIGWEEDVVTTTRERMFDYYHRHYTPDRATLVVVGGVDRDRVIARTGELFGAIPRGDVARFEQKEPPPRGETRITMIQDTQVPRLLLAFRSVKLLDPREPLLDIVSAVLAGEKTSRLEKALVDTGVAASVQAYSDTRRDDGLFMIDAQPAEGTTLDALEAGIKAVLADLVAKGPTADEVGLARARLLAEQTYTQETSSGLANRYGSMAAVGDWRYVLRYPSVLEAATPASVQAVAAAVFDPTKAVVGRSLPKAGGAGGGGAGPEAPGMDPGMGSGMDAGMERTGARRKALGKGAYRARFRDGAAQGPAGGGGASAIIDRALTLAPVRKVLPNGLTVLVLRRGQAPVFNAQVSIEDGRLGEAVAGLDALTGALLDEGTAKRSAEQVAQAIGAVGGSVNAGPGGVTVRALSKDASLALEVLAEVATEPAFAPDAVERLKTRQLSEIAEELDTPRARGQQAFNAAVYGEHPYGRFGKGTPETVKSLTREQVLAHYARFWTPRNALLSIVSDRDPAEVMALVEKAFGGWKGGDAPKLAPAAPPAPKAQVVRVDLERAQTNVFVGHLGIVRSDPDYVALEVMDNVFGVGAGFTDRLSKTIRDQAGLAYTVFGSVTRSASKVPGTFLMYAGTKPEDAERARAMMHEQLKGLLERPATPDELAGAKAAMRGAMVMGCESGSGLLAILRMCERYGLGFDYPKRYVQDLEKVTAEDVTRVAKAHLNPAALTEVIVGPAAPAEKPVPTGAGAGR